MEKRRREIASAVFQGLKAINKALRTAKQFETLRVLRKEKSTTSDNDDKTAVKRIETATLALDLVTALADVPPFAVTTETVSRFLKLTGTPTATATATSPASSASEVDLRTRVISHRAVQNAVEKLTQQLRPMVTLLLTTGGEIAKSGGGGEQGRRKEEEKDDDDRGNGKYTGGEDDGDSGDDLDGDAEKLLEKITVVRGGTPNTRHPGTASSGIDDEETEDDDSCVIDMEWSGDEIGAEDADPVKPLPYPPNTGSSRSDSECGDEDSDDFVVKTAADTTGLMQDALARKLEKEGRTSELLALERQRRRSSRAATVSAQGGKDASDVVAKPKNRLGQRARKHMALKKEKFQRIKKERELVAAGKSGGGLPPPRGGKVGRPTRGERLPGPPPPSRKKRLPGPSVREPLPSYGAINPSQAARLAAAKKMPTGLVPAAGKKITF